MATSSESAPAPQPIQRRCVIYVSGFDPAGPAKYHQLYRDEAAKAQAVTGLQIEVGARRNDKASHTASWTVQATDANSGTSTETDYVFARWDDIVRQYWLPLDTWLARWRFVHEFFWAHTAFVFSGTLRKMHRLGRAPTLAVTMPLLLALLVIATAVLSIGFLGHFWHSARMESAWIAIILIAFIAATALAAYHVEQRWRMLWLMRSYILTAHQARGQTPDLDARLQQVGKLIAQRVRSAQYDEVLVVGHSSGCMMACLALAHALRTLRAEATGFRSPALLTLGHWWPLLGCFDSAQAQRDSLRVLSDQADLHWVDVSAKADGCCFAFVDPVTSLLGGDAGPTRAHTVSARLHTLFEPTAYRALCADRFRLHFQYIHASPVLGPCDYFAITAGSQSLQEHFRNVPRALA
jgi:hypothetical protein